MHSDGVEMRLSACLSEGLVLLVRWKECWFFVLVRMNIRHGWEIKMVSCVSTK